MNENIEVSFETLEDKVHQTKVGDDAIEKKITLARRMIDKNNLPIELVVCDRRLLRRDKNALP
jgi:hypothetical protein